MPLTYTNKRIAIISHVYAPGPPHELEAFLRDKVATLAYIAHPFPFAKEGVIQYKLYTNSKLTYEVSGRVWRLPELLLYLKDFLANLFFFARQPAYDLIIALDNLNATSAIWLKAVGKTKRVVFYTIDYVPERFANKMLNWFYHRLDSFCVKRSDYVWNLASVMANKREEKGVSARYRAKQLTVPIGTHILPTFKGKRKANLVVFMGHLREGQGLDRLIEALPIIRKSLPRVKLRLIGGGPLEQQFRKEVLRLGLSQSVEITGFVSSNKEMRRLLAEGTIAIAPYQDVPTNYTRFTDPGKPKEYLAAGLPVVITKVPMFAWVIDARRAGKMVADDSREIAKAVIALLNDPALGEYQQNARELAAESTWEMVFTKAFKEMNG